MDRLLSSATPSLIYIVIMLDIAYALAPIHSLCDLKGPSRAEKALNLDLVAELLAKKTERASGINPIQPAEQQIDSEINAQLSSMLEPLIVRGINKDRESVKGLYEDKQLKGLKRLSFDLCFRALDSHSLAELLIEHGEVRTIVERAKLAGGLAKIILA
jgi:hypothetical protein